MTPVSQEIQKRERKARPKQSAAAVMFTVLLLLSGGRRFDKLLQ
jgi:hypothetical protein